MQMIPTYLDTRVEVCKALFGCSCTGMGVTNVGVLLRQGAALVFHPLSQLAGIALEYPQL